MMNEILYTVSVLVAGMALGTIFFGGLWLTVRKMVRSKKPALWLLASFFARTAITLVGFYFVGGGSLERLLLCLAGFIAARFVVVYYTKTTKAKSYQIQKEVSHETKS